MSRRPAVGTFGLSHLQSWLSSPPGRAYIAETGDVPQALRLDGKTVPLGRTMVDKLRLSSGVPLTDPRRMEKLRVKAEVLAVEFPDLRQASLDRRAAQFHRLVNSSSVNRTKL